MHGLTLLLKTRGKKSLMESLLAQRLLELVRWNAVSKAPDATVTSTYLSTVSN